MASFQHYILFLKSHIPCVLGITTKIILLFLAATDLLVMIEEFFLHYVPFYWQWFPVFYSGTCGLAMVIQSTTITASSWYITLMTIERFIAVWFPMKV